MGRKGIISHYYLCAGLENLLFGYVNLPKTFSKTITVISFLLLPVVKLSPCSVYSYFMVLAVRAILP